MHVSKQCMIRFGLIGMRAKRVRHRSVQMEVVGYSTVEPQSYEPLGEMTVFMHRLADTEAIAL